MVFCEHLSETNSYLCLMCWEERTSTTDIRSDMECSNRVRRRKYIKVAYAGVDLYNPLHENSR